MIFYNDPGFYKARVFLFLLGSWNFQQWYKGKYPDAIILHYGKKGN